jgi:hypothetical protein
MYYTERAYVISHCIPALLIVFNNKFKGEFQTFFTDKNNLKFCCILPTYLARQGKTCRMYNTVKDA